MTAHASSKCPHVHVCCHAGSQPAGALRPFRLRHRAQRRLQPHTDTVWLPGAVPEEQLTVWLPVAMP
eukprot:335219-Chlamydomonas_euryale.AAC.1